MKFTDSMKVMWHQAQMQALLKSVHKTLGIVQDHRKANAKILCKYLGPDLVDCEACDTDYWMEQVEIDVDERSSKTYWICPGCSNRQELRLDGSKV